MSELVEENPESDVVAHPKPEDIQLGAEEQAPAESAEDEPLEVAGASDSDEPTPHEQDLEEQQTDTKATETPRDAPESQPESPRASESDSDSHPAVDREQADLQVVQAADSEDGDERHVYEHEIEEPYARVSVEEQDSSGASSPYNGYAMDTRRKISEEKEEPGPDATVASPFRPEEGRQPPLFGDEDAHLESKRDTHSEETRRPSAVVARDLGYEFKAPEHYLEPVQDHEEEDEVDINEGQFRCQHIGGYVLLPCSEEELRARLGIAGATPEQKSWVNDLLRKNAKIMNDLCEEQLASLESTQKVLKALSEFVGESSSSPSALNLSDACQEAQTQMILWKEKVDKAMDSVQETLVILKLDSEGKDEENAESIEVSLLPSPLREMPRVTLQRVRAARSPKGRPFAVFEFKLFFGGLLYMFEGRYKELLKIHQQLRDHINRIFETSWVKPIFPPKFYWTNVNKSRGRELQNRAQGLVTYFQTLVSNRKMLALQELHEALDLDDEGAKTMFETSQNMRKQTSHIFE